MLRLSGPARRVARSVVEALPPPLKDRIDGYRVAWAQRGLVPPSKVSAADNVGYNSEIWDWYAERWNDPAFRSHQLSYEGRTGEDPAAVARLGEEWGRLDDAIQIIDEWILPHVGPSSVCGEIGTGGGRVAVRVAPKVAEFHAFDISKKMLALVQAELADVGGARFHHLVEPALPAEFSGHFDFLYSFDVFVHLDLHVQWRYLQEITRALKPGGKAFLHTANLTSDAGWQRFAEQDHYRVEGFYFTTPQAVRTLVERAGLRLIAERSGGSENFYYERDLFVLVERARTTA